MKDQWVFRPHASSLDTPISHQFCFQSWAPILYMQKNSQYHDTAKVNKTHSLRVFSYDDAFFLSKTHFLIYKPGRLSTFARQKIQIWSFFVLFHRFFRFHHFSTFFTCKSLLGFRTFPYLPPNPIFRHFLTFFFINQGLWPFSPTLSWSFWHTLRGPSAIPYLT